MKKFDPAFFSPMNNVDDHPQKESVTDKDAMRCAGCGAKVGSTILTGVLDGLSIPPDPHVKVGFQDADDAAVLDLPSDRLLIQTIDGFRAFIDDLYTFGRIALIHAASDIFAMGGVPHTALIMVTLPFAAKHLVADDLKQLMTGVADEASRMNLTIIGGHTSEGSETSIGIMMNGLTDPKDISKKENLKVGDALVLT
jgi:selenide,water dikinase